MVIPVGGVAVRGDHRTGHRHLLRPLGRVAARQRHERRRRHGRALVVQQLRRTRRRWEAQVASPRSQPRVGAPTAVGSTPSRSPAPRAAPSPAPDQHATARRHAARQRRCLAADRPSGRRPARGVHDVLPARRRAHEPRRRCDVDGHHPAEVGLCPRPPGARAVSRPGAHRCRSTSEPGSSPRSTPASRSTRRSAASTPRA